MFPTHIRWTLVLCGTRLDCTYLLDISLYIVQILINLLVDLLDGLSEVYNEYIALQDEVELCRVVCFDGGGRGIRFELLR